MSSADDILTQREEALRAQEEAEKQKALKRLNAYRSFFQGPSGLQVLECLRESCDGNTFRTDPYESAYAAGRRSVYLNIIETVSAAETVLAFAEPTKAPVASMQTRAELPATIEEL